MGGFEKTTAARKTSRARPPKPYLAATRSSSQFGVQALACQPVLQSSVTGKLKVELQTQSRPTRQDAAIGDVTISLTPGFIMLKGQRHARNCFNKFAPSSETVETALFRSLFSVAPLKANLCSSTNSSPSPQGRGRTIWRPMCSERRRRSKNAPSPSGEVRGEGDRDIRTASTRFQRDFHKRRLHRRRLSQ